MLRAASIGSVLARANGDLPNDAGMRQYGGGDRRSPVWTPLDPNGKSVAGALNKGGLFYADTGHTVVPPFLDWWAAESPCLGVGMSTEARRHPDGPVR